MDLVFDDSQKLRRVFSCFPSGVTAICALSDGHPLGLAVSSFTSVSLRPALASICIQASSRTWRTLQHAPRLGISVLAEEHAGVCRRLASKTEDRFTDVRWSASEEGAVFIDGASAVMDCSIAQHIHAGDHEIVVLSIREARDRLGIAPLVFYGSRFHGLTSREGETANYS